MRLWVAEPKRASLDACLVPLELLRVRSELWHVLFRRLDRLSHCLEVQR